MDKTLSKFDVAYVTVTSGVNVLVLVPRSKGAAMRSIAGQKQKLPLNAGTKSM